MSPQTSVAIIGAGVSGVAAAIHCKAEGLNVTLFERSSVPGGVWVFDKRLPPEPAYPSEAPSEADLAAQNRVIQEKSKNTDASQEAYVKDVYHAPPGPCYEHLSNNVPTDLMKLQVNSWPPGTPPIVAHSVLRDYIQDTARKYQVDKYAVFNTRVDHATKVGSKWRLETTTLPREFSQVTEVDHGKHDKLISKVWEFDKLIVASGHYHACRVPDIPGLSLWKSLWPSRIQHSKSYRNADGFKDKTVLLIGAGVSSLDIAKELGTVAAKVYQSSRGGLFDLPATLLPSNATRIGAISSFEASTALNLDPLPETEPIPGAVKLEDGQILQNIDHIILGTGYHMSYPFLKHLHSDKTAAIAADDQILVTDGTQMHNLHLDIFYIPDPTLAFVGVPYHVATFSFFEYQAIAVARVFANKARLPSEDEMRKAYRKRVATRGVGKAFHSLMGMDESEYVDELVAWLNADGKEFNAPELLGHSAKWRQDKLALLKKKDSKFQAAAVSPEVISEVTELKT